MKLQISISAISIHRRNYCKYKLVGPSIATEVVAMLKAHGLILRISSMEISIPF